MRYLVELVRTTEHSTELYVDANNEDDAFTCALQLWKETCDNDPYDQALQWKYLRQYVDEGEARAVKEIEKPAV